MNTFQSNNVINPFNIFKRKTQSTPICDVKDLQIKNSQKGIQTSCADTFTKSLPKLEEELIPLENKNSYNKVREDLKEIHKRRMKIYGSKETRKPPKNVSKEEYNAINLIQLEMSEYFSTQKKLRAGEELTKKEEKFCEEVIKGMRKTEEEKTVWRNISAYPGFIDSINSGEINLLGFTSTASEYTDFFDFWELLDIKNVNGKRYTQLPYMLKINLPIGTPILDCNATYKGKGTRLPEEVVILPASCKVKNIDVENRVIELDYNK